MLYDFRDHLVQTVDKKKLGEPSLGSRSTILILFYFWKGKSLKSRLDFPF